MATKDPGSTYGNNDDKQILPKATAKGPGFLGPDYNPADEMLTPAQVGVRRGDGLSDVINAAKGVGYYADMIGFGEPSSAFTRGMPGLRPLGVNYFLKTGLTCSNGAEMWEYVSTVPDGSALGSKVQQSIRDMGLPQMRGMGPGIIEDAKAALNPMPVLNAVLGSGYPKCKLVRYPVGDFDGKITNTDGNLIADPEGLIESGGRFFQEKWVQDRAKPKRRRRPGENDMEYFLAGEQIQLDYDVWNKEPKLYAENGCAKDPRSGLEQPKFCGKQPTKQLRMEDNSTVNVFVDGFEHRVGRSQTMNANHVKLAVSVIGVLGVLALVGRK
jgi:hypothetical protein